MHKPTNLSKPWLSHLQNEHNSDNYTTRGFIVRVQSHTGVKCLILSLNDDDDDDDDDDDGDWCHTSILRNLYFKKEAHFFSSLLVSNHPRFGH